MRARASLPQGRWFWVKEASGRRPPIGTDRHPRFVSIGNLSGTILADDLIRGNDLRNGHYPGSISGVRILGLISHLLDVLINLSMACSLSWLAPKEGAHAHRNVRLHPPRGIGRDSGGQFGPGHPLREFLEVFKTHNGQCVLSPFLGFQDRQLCQLVAVGERQHTHERAPVGVVIPFLV